MIIKIARSLLSLSSKFSVGFRHPHGSNGAVACPFLFGCTAEAIRYRAFKGPREVVARLICFWAPDAIGWSDCLFAWLQE
jgi:hypothetical protein